MGKRLADHLKSNLWGIAAVFIALGGTAVAATVARNTVDSASIKPNSVRSSDVLNNGLTGIDVRNLGPADIANLGSADIASLGPDDIDGLTGADVADNSLTGADIDQSTLLPGSTGVVARLRGTTPLTTTGATTPLAVSGNTWTQGADETDREFFGVVQVTAGTCLESGGSPEVIFGFALDGTQLPAFDDASAGTSGLKSLGPVLLSLFEPGAPTGRTLTVTARDNCTGGGSHPTINSISLNVVGIR